MSANALIQGTTNIGMLLGLAISGMMIALINAENVLFVNSATFLISALCLMPIRFTSSFARAKAGIPGPYVQELKAGFRFIVGQQPMVLTLVIISSLYNLGVSAFVFILPVYAKEFLQVGPVQLGKQYDPAEWSSPPLEAKLVDKPGVGKVLMGRGAVNQKGPQSALLAALHAIRDSKQTLPVNLVLVAEGEEEIGSPHISQLARKPEVAAALAKTVGVFMPSASQDLDGNVTVTLGAKGIVELELIASGEKWGRGPAKDIHSSFKAMVDSPAWRLVKALDTLVSDDGNTITIRSPG